MQNAALVASDPPKSHIRELFLPQTNRRFGFRVGGLIAGPNVVVVSQTALAKRVYQRLLLIPGLNRLKGMLFLILQDQLDDLQYTGSLCGLVGADGPIDRILTLPALDIETLDDSATAEMVRRNYYAVLRLCARLGMVHGRGISDRDTPLA